MKSEMISATDAEVLLADGSKKTLSDIWRTKPLALIFLRHFG
jgi:hypothetical protein